MTGRRLLAGHKESFVWTADLTRAVSSMTPMRAVVHMCVCERRNPALLSLVSKHTVDGGESRRQY